MKYLIILAVLLVLVGCNSTSPVYHSPDGSNQNVAVVDANDGVVCKMEKRIGSNMMTRVCRTAEDRAAEAEASREGMLRFQRGSVTSGADGE